MARIVPDGGFQLQPFRRPREVKEPHRLFIRRLPCLVCTALGVSQASDSDPAHIRTASLFHGKSETGGGRTADDRFTLPLCRAHHSQQHAENELEFWHRNGIDPFLLALILWGLTGDEHGARQVIALHVRKAAC